MFHGILNVNKPSGITSRDVVDRIQRFVRPAKIGHAGTLDPLACGVLVVCIGAATRLASYAQRLTKRYRATFLLGCTSSTEDIEGDVVEIANAPRPSLEEIRLRAAALTGTIQQTPPAFSALKVGGRRAYAMARKGEEVNLAPREITVYRFEILDYAYPQFVAEIECSAGTYVRSLGRDLGEMLGTGTVMSALTREAIGHFHLQDAAPLDAITAENIGAWLRPPIDALAGMPRIVVSADDARRASYGQKLAVQADVVAPEYAAVDAAGTLVAILAPAEEGFRVQRYFPA